MQASMEMNAMLPVRMARISLATFPRWCCNAEIRRTTASDPCSWISLPPPARWPVDFARHATAERWSELREVVDRWDRSRGRPTPLPWTRRTRCPSNGVTCCPRSVWRLWPWNETKWESMKLEDKWNSARSSSTSFNCLFCIQYAHRFLLFMTRIQWIPINPFLLHLNFLES